MERQTTSYDFLAAEELLAIRDEDGLALYGTLHQAARKLVEVDAFYICLIQRDPNWLHFVFNCEGDLFDKPEPFPFGDGPTSRVATTGKPIVMLTSEDRVQFNLLPFANGDTISRSAVHWPLWIESERSNLPDGVLSVQCYEAEAYDRQELAAIEWLAYRASDILRRHQVETLFLQRIAKAELSASRSRAVEDTRRFVTILDEIASLKGDPSRLLGEVRRRQVELTQWAPTADVPKNDLSEKLASLTLRELEVLSYIASGLSTKDVAIALGIASSTVKRHLENVYQGGLLTRRGEVIAAADAIREARIFRDQKP